jgi:hypothetical protein
MKWLVPAVSRIETPVFFARPDSALVFMLLVVQRVVFLSYDNRDFWEVSERHRRSSGAAI